MARDFETVNSTLAASIASAYLAFRPFSGLYPLKLIRYSSIGSTETGSRSLPAVGVDSDKRGITDKCTRPFY